MPGLPFWTGMSVGTGLYGRAQQQALQNQLAIKDQTLKQQELQLQGLRDHLDANKFDLTLAQEGYGRMLAQRQAIATSQAYAQMALQPGLSFKEQNALNQAANMAINQAPDQAIQKYLEDNGVGNAAKMMEAEARYQNSLTAMGRSPYQNYRDLGSGYSGLAGGALYNAAGSRIPGYSAPPMPPSPFGGGGGYGPPPSYGAPGPPGPYGAGGYGAMAGPGAGGGGPAMVPTAPSGGVPGLTKVGRTTMYAPNTTISRGGHLYRVDANGDVWDMGTAMTVPTGGGGTP